MIPIIAFEMPHVKLDFQSSVQPESIAGGREGYYVGKTDQAGRTQGVIEVDIFSAYEGQAMYIDFMVSGNTPGHILGAVGEVFNEKKRQFNFVFKDNRGNKGRGIFAHHGKNYVLHLELARLSPSGAVKGYSSSDYVVIRQEAKARKDRHPWSADRIHKVPAIMGFP